MFAVVAALVAAACSDPSDGAAGLGPPPTPTVLAPTTLPTPPTSPGAESTTSTAAVSTTTAPTTTTVPPVPLTPLGELELTWAAIAAGFAQPVFLTSAPGDERLFVVDQPGVIWAIAGEDAAEFLDIRDQVNFRGERGLLGLAFHPDYETNGRVFTYYIDNDGDTVVAEFASDGDVAMVDSQRVILSIAQPASNHNGGMIAFGPDGYLWIGTGDGGGSDDRFGHGQRSDTLLAAMLRIDVDGAMPYAVPADNPFADGETGAPEVWAFGLRNPWRWSFDGSRIIIGDVGQNDREEVSIADVGEGGLNYGWPIMEASACFQRSGCDQSGLVLPIVEYRHSVGCSITGGYVYRGSEIPELDGHYFYGDYCNGWVNSVVIDTAGAVGEIIEWSERGTLPSLTSFGVDGAGELYATTADGTVWKLERR